MGLGMPKEQTWCMGGSSVVVVEGAQQAYFQGQRKNLRALTIEATTYIKQ
jgi:hypothetical protein